MTNRHYFIIALMLSILTGGHRQVYAQGNSDTIKTNVRAVVSNTRPTTPNNTFAVSNNISIAPNNIPVAPNNISIPWYSQKIAGYPYTHCSLASSLMVFDYFKGMTADAQRSVADAEKKLIEYQRDYFMKKRAPFRRRTSIGQGSYYSFELDSLARYYENMVSAEHFQQKDYKILKSYINRGIPVLVNVRYTGATRGLRPGPRGHWIVLRGIDDKHVWVNDPGRSPAMRDKAENICYPIKKQPGNPSYFDGCWTGRFIIVTPKEWIRNPLCAKVGKLPRLDAAPPLFSAASSVMSATFRVPSPITLSVNLVQ